MDDNAGRDRAAWPWRAVASAAAAAVVLGGCGSGDDDKSAEPSPSASSRSSAPAASGSSSSPSSTGGDAKTLTPFRADPAQVPRTKAQAEALAAAVALGPEAWGADFRAQRPAASTARTVAVLDEQCRWERRPLPKGVLASLSRYSELPGAGGKGEIKVTAAVTVHTTVLDADDQLSTTLEEPLRCREQQVRTDERISELMSTGNVYGQGNNTYSDDQVVEIGSYLTGTAKQKYFWFVTRLGTVTLAVSVKGAEGYTESELNTYASQATSTMLGRVEFELGGKN
ncbi:hypothetical protein [Streptomyces zaehneri]|uniref:hypothetical protein n=1 Tax=Streptomyces zaehneri TaxID=3051180 RepID=UPI0028D2CD1D|nr:hypothetical protein [Streptomyces sp. DSM 40713]